MRMTELNRKFILNEWIILTQKFGFLAKPTSSCLYYNETNAYFFFGGGSMK
jgi:hypothetical protein